MLKYSVLILQPGLVKAMVTIPIVKAMGTIPIVKAMVTIPIVKAMVTIPIVKAMVTIPIVKPGRFTAIKEVGKPEPIVVSKFRMKDPIGLLLLGGSFLKQEAQAASPSGYPLSSRSSSFLGSLGRPHAIPVLCVGCWR